MDEAGPGAEHGSETGAKRPERRRERWLLLVILGVFLGGLPGIFSYPAEKILFNPQPYKAALDSEGAYQQFPALVGEMIAGGGNLLLLGSGDRLLRALEQGNYKAVVRQIFPEDWVREQANSLIDQFWAYFNFQSPQFRLVVDLRPVKARLEGQQAAQIAATIVQGFPPCQAEEILNWGLLALQGKAGSLPLCRPPDRLVGIANLLVSEVLKGAGAALPDELDLATALKLPLGGRPTSAAWSRFFGLYYLYRQVNLCLPVAALALLALDGLLAWKSQRGVLFWLGIGLALPGLVALFTAAALWIVSSQIAPLVIARLFGTDVVVFHLLVGMLASVLGSFTAVSEGIALGATLLGVAMVVLANRFPHLHPFSR